MRESRSPPPFNEEPQISKDFWGFFVFLPADLFLLRWGYSSLFFFIGFHGWIGWQSCLSDYSRISADIWPLANGSRPKWAPIVFVTQISQMTQIFFIDCLRPTDFTDLHRFFLIDYFSPTDFTDSHRFFSFIIFLMDLHGFSLVLFFPCHFFFFLSFLYSSDFRPVGQGGWRRFFMNAFCP